MTSRADIIAEARSWIGTPWRHQGRLKGIAADCVCVIVKAPVACGLFPPDFDITGYPRFPDHVLMQKVLDQYLDPVELGKQEGGDVLLLRPKRIPHHLGILTFENSVIHAIDPKRGVTEHRIDDRWKKTIVRVYRYRGLTS